MDLSYNFIITATIHHLYDVSNEQVAREKLSYHSSVRSYTGCKVIGDRPSLSLQNRLDVALSIYFPSRSESNCFRWSGEDEDIEAHSMRNYLMVQYR